ncbi:hypothetical protein C1H46_041252 [Malus baccata]|uniref:Uncharacterized protein n=1 Tax=Malus baccata TaxID=106549 RepID=A0A540KGT2_MALBA|nr:hypothetical protein C1H46_041252 [Malus baccata]
MGCSLKVEDEVGHSDDINTGKGLRRSKRVGYFLGAIKDHTKQEERKVNKQSKKVGRKPCVFVGMPLAISIEPDTVVKGP